MTDRAAQSQQRRGLYRAFSALVLSQVIAALLGYAYWVAAARALHPIEIAEAYSSVAAMMLLGNLAQLGYGTLLVSELPTLNPNGQRALLRNALINVTGAGLLLGLAWALVAPHIGPTFHRALANPSAATALVLGVAGTAVGLVLDQAVLGLGRSGVQVVRNLLAASLKFPLALILIAFGHKTHTALLAAWVVPLYIGALAVLLLLRLPAASSADESLKMHVRRLGPTALLHHTLNLSLQASPLLLPLLAARALPGEQYASFSVAWLIATFVFIPPFMLAVALFATSVGDIDAFSRLARRTLPNGMMISLACYLGAALLAQPVMTVFGHHYTSDAPNTLRILALGGFAFVVKDHFFALYRVQRRLGYAALIGTLGIVAELAGAGIGAAYWHLDGLAIGWLIGLYLQAVLMAPVIARHLRRAGSPALETEHPMP